MMRFAYAGVLSLLLVTGCTKSEPIPNSAPPAGGQAAATSNNSPADNAPIPQDLTVTLAESDRPATREDWAREFRKRANSNVYDAFLQLTFWGESTDEEKRQFLQDIKTIFQLQQYGTAARIGSDADFRFFEFQQYQKEYPGAFYPRKKDLNKTVAPEPTDAVQIAYPLTGSISIHPTFALGRHNDKYYICAFKSPQP